MSPQNIPSWILQDQSLAKRTYYRIGGTARFFAEPASFAHVREAMLLAREHNWPFAFLGAGSNSLFSDNTFDGMVISFEKLNHAFWETPEILYAEAGVENTTIAEMCKQAQRKGAAWMFKLPGQVGATARMNARCYGGEISQIVTEIVTIDLNGNLKMHSAHDVFLGYKNTSLMKTAEAVVAVRFHFPQTESASAIDAEMTQCETDRNAKHHFEAPSCGSTFKNNYEIGVPSGRIFDELGFRGAQEGGARVSLHHANFIQNTGSATAKDVLSLAARMKQTALEKKNAHLSLEVEAIGTFHKELSKACGLTEQASAPQSQAWCGLAWHPSQPDPSPTFPAIVFAAPCLEYFRLPAAGEPHVKVSLTQLRPLSEARHSPHSPFLRWETRVPQNSLERIFPLMPNAPEESFLNELWNYSVSEVFFEHPHRTEYDEYEMTPKKHWIAIAHEGKRVRKPGHEKPSSAFFPHTRCWAHENAFGMDFTFSQLSHLIHSQSMRILCALSLGNGRYFLCPHWKDDAVEPNSVWINSTPPNVKADFHQPHRWWNVHLLDN
jgi:UDP-N-acetylmuramate dehydrogenase